MRLCVSAAEALPPQTFDRFKERFGLEIIDGIGSTEMLHIFCSNRPGEIVPGTTGRPVPGYELRIVDEDGRVLEGPAVGGLEVRGDSCAAFYWHQHEKTKRCMRGDWFATGDRYERRDGRRLRLRRADGRHAQGRRAVGLADRHGARAARAPARRGVGVVGVTRRRREPRSPPTSSARATPGDDALADELRTWCKERLRRYEYPHVVEFVDELPRTLTGKVQRFRLRELAARRSVRLDHVRQRQVLQPQAAAATSLPSSTRLIDTSQQLLGAALEDRLGEDLDLGHGHRAQEVGVVAGADRVDALAPATAAQAPALATASTAIA